jgi:hypothetical protein
VTSVDGGGGRITAAVTDAVERVFGTVADVHAAAVRSLEPVARDGADGAPAGDAPELGTAVRRLLSSPGQLATGLGVILAPQAGTGRPGHDVPVRLHWWQLDPDNDRLLSLDPDLKPSSAGFYDYTAAPWFAVPRETGRRHVVGPYVDVHGSGQYLLTLTEPVVAEGRFLGVAGADVPVSRFEVRLLGGLGTLAQAFLLVNEEGRVVVSTSPRWLVGSLVPPAGGLGAGARVGGVPWRLHLLPA